MTGNLPNQPNIKQTHRKYQNKKAMKGLKEALRMIIFFIIKGKNNKQQIKSAINKIPNNLSVTLRRTAYKGKKYHSGTICAGSN